MSSPTLLRIQDKLVDVNDLLDSIEQSNRALDYEFTLNGVELSSHSDMEWYDSIREAA